MENMIRGEKRETVRGRERMENIREGEEGGGERERERIIFLANMRKGAGEVVRAERERTPHTQKKKKRKKKKKKIEREAIKYFLLAVDENKFLGGAASRGG